MSNELAQPSADSRFRGATATVVGMERASAVAVDDAEAVFEHMDAQPEGSIAWVASRYIERPLLVPGGRKFDIRCWVLLDGAYGIHLCVPPPTPARARAVRRPPAGRPAPRPP